MYYVLTFLPFFIHLAMNKNRIHFQINLGHRVWMKNLKYFWLWFEAGRALNLWEWNWENLRRNKGFWKLNTVEMICSVDVRIWICYVLTSPTDFLLLPDFPRSFVIPWKLKMVCSDSLNWWWNSYLYDLTVAVNGSEWLFFSSSVNKNRINVRYRSENSNERYKNVQFLFIHSKRIVFFLSLTEIKLR